MKKFVKAVMVTTILSIITRALGLILKIYISREIGAVALGFYQIALSVFFLLCTLVTSGIPLIISRKIAKDPARQSSIVFSGLIVSTAISAIVCVFILLCPQLLVVVWNQNESLSCLLALLPAIIFTALYVPFRGAFWGTKNFFLLGFVELLEQVIRFVACFIMFSLVLPLSGATIAGTTYSIACGLSSIIAIIIYFVKGYKIKPNTKQILPLIKESAPIASIRIGSSFVSFAVSLIFPIMLVKCGHSSDEAIGFFGIVTGMVMPLITIPGTLISSISVALIPEISGKSETVINKHINNALSFSIMISFLLLPTFITLGKPLGQLLFKSELAGELLKVGSILLLPMGISQISSSILNAINKERRGLINYIVGAVLLLVSVCVLPKFLGVYSLVAGFLLMSLSDTLLNLFAFTNYLSSYSLKTLIFSTLFCIPSGLIAHFSYGVFRLILSPIIAIIIASGLSIIFLLLFYQLFHFINIFDYLPERMKLSRIKT